MLDTSHEIIDYFSRKAIDANSLSYLHTHAKRFAYMIHAIRRIRAAKKTPLVAMDIGPSFFTELYANAFPEDSLYTLGLDRPENRGGHFPSAIDYAPDQHIFFDLNECQEAGRLPEAVPACDIVIMAEVIEHLYTAPEIVLASIRSAMKPGGHLILQTPNAAELTKRTKLMFQGRNPYERIRVDAHNPGHFREYTKNELVGVAKTAGFAIDRVERTNYFAYDSNKGPMQKAIRSLSPSGLRRYIFMILKNLQ